MAFLATSAAIARLADLAMAAAFASGLAASRRFTARFNRRLTKNGQKRAAREQQRSDHAKING